MSMIAQTVAEFGRSLGLSDLRLRANGSTVLSVQSIGLLGFDVAGPAQDAIVISLSKPLSATGAGDQRRLLSFAHHRSRPRLPVHFGAHAGHLILAVVLRQEEFTLLRINEVIHALDQQHQALEVSP